MKYLFALLIILPLTSCFEHSPDPVIVNPPTSVSTFIPKENAIVIILTKKGKVYLILGDTTHKDAILSNLNTNMSLSLNNLEIAKLKKMDSIGLPLNKLKTFLDLTNPELSSQMEGIPTKDSTNNELIEWIKAVTQAYKGEDINKLNLILKGDRLAEYPEFKNIKAAFMKNNIYKFKIVTSN